MKRTYLQFSAAVMVAACLFACQKDLSGSRSESNPENSSSISTSNARVASSCGQLRTFTQGGWGANPSGNNPGTYLHANFSGAFGSGLTVGCAPSGYYINLTYAQAVTNLLPTGGKASALSTNATNPASIKNVLVGQLVALKLSVGFDAYDANFGESPVKLGNMIIGSGTFKGYSVSKFLAIAEKVLGGCSTQFTPEQVNETASAINENFDNGNTNKGFLACPDGDGDDDGGGDDGGNPPIEQ
jgi:hypothetical protein